MGSTQRSYRSVTKRRLSTSTQGNNEAIDYSYTTTLSTAVLQKICTNIIQQI